QLDGEQRPLRRQAHRDRPPERAAPEHLLPGPAELGRRGHPRPWPSALRGRQAHLASAREGRRPGRTASMTMTPEAKRKLSGTIRGLREYLIDKLDGDLEKAYRFRIPRAQDAG